MISQLFTSGPFWSNPLFQSTVCIAAGLIVSLLLRRRSARAHQVLFLAMIASVAVPAMSMIVRHYELGIFVDKPAVTKFQLSEIPIVPIIREYEISSLPAIPNAYSPPAIEPEYAIPAATAVSEAKARLPLSTILIWSWIIVSTILTARLFVTFILGLRTLQRAFPLHCDKLEQALLIAKGKLGIDKPVEVLAGSTVSSPVIWCWSRRPALLVPEDSEQFEDSVDWVDMFCHEMAHWSRLDHISGLFAELIVCIFPWHPLMWWAKRRLAGLSEQACDDWVVASSRSPADYAESLLDLTPQGQLSFLPAVVGRKNGLESRVRRIIKDKCGKPSLGLCWAVVVTLIAACITIGAAFAQTRPADIDEVTEECEKLLAEEQKNELGAEEKSVFEAELLARKIELLNQQQELQAEQNQLEQLVNQLQSEKTKLRKRTESAVQLRLEQLKHLNALAHQQAEYQKQAKIIESEIQLLQHATDKAKQHHAEGLSDFVVDKHEHETRELQVQELVAELRALRAKISNIENLLQATISKLYGQTKQRSQFVQTTRDDPLQQTAERDQLAQYKRILEIESDNLKQELDFLDGLRQEELEKAKTHEQMRATLEAIDKNRHRIRSNVPSTLIGGELFWDDELAVLKKIRSDLQILADKTRLKLEECHDKKEINKLQGVLDNIDAFIKYIDGRIPDYLRSRELTKTSELSLSIQRQKLIDHRSELEERKRQIRRQIEIAPDRKDAEELLLELDQMELEMLDIENRLNAMSQQQRLQSGDKYEAKRRELLPKRRELEYLRKRVQLMLKEAPNREDAARLGASLDEIDKQIREIDFELSSPEWCAQKRKAEQTAMQKYKSEMERAKSNFNKMIKRKDHVKAELKNREAEWWAELRAFEAAIITTQRSIRDAKDVLENNQATLLQMNKEIESFRIIHTADLATDISLFNKLKTMEANRELLLKKIERDKVRLAKYQDELKAQEKLRDAYLKYKRPADTELDYDYWTPKGKAKAPAREDRWLTTPPQLPQDRDFGHRDHEFQTTTPPSQQGQDYYPWQPEEKLESRINQLQDEISRLRKEMAEMRKLMKDMVEHEKKRPKLSNFNIDKDPMDIEENRRKKPLPEIHSYPLEPGKKQPYKSPEHIDKDPMVPKLKKSPLTGLLFKQGNKENSSKRGKKQPTKPLAEIHGDPSVPEKIEPAPGENKPGEHPPDDILIELEEIEKVEP